MLNKEICLKCKYYREFTKTNEDGFSYMFLDKDVQDSIKRCLYSNQEIRVYRFSEEEFKEPPMNCPYQFEHLLSSQKLED